MEKLGFLIWYAMIFQKAVVICIICKGIWVVVYLINDSTRQNGMPGRTGLYISYATVFLPTGSVTTAFTTIQHSKPTLTFLCIQIHPFYWVVEDRKQMSQYN